MELFDLKYFVAVASCENLHRAAQQICVSPATLSKAIGRLESELDIELFTRVGRTIELTEHGDALHTKALEIIRLEEEVKASIAGGKSSINIHIAGRDVLLTEVSSFLVKTIIKSFPQSSFYFHSESDDNVIQAIIKGEAHLGVITSNIPAGLKGKILQRIKFRTFVGKSHPLYKRVEAKSSVSIDELLKYPFVGAGTPFFGKMRLKQSHDGWRDDQFRRKIFYVAPNIQIMADIAQSGLAVAYLPENLIKRLEGGVLSVSGCQFSCTQEIKLIMKSSPKAEWLKKLGQNHFDLLK